MKNFALLLLTVTSLSVGPMSFGAGESDAPPQTKAEAFKRLNRTLSRQAIEELKSTRRDDLIQYHHGFGTGIRNSFGLWAGNRALAIDLGAKPDMHPDGVSVLLIEAYWDYLNQDVPALPLDRLEPEAYFEKVLFYLRRAFLAEDVRLVNRLPKWVFESGGPDEVGPESQRRAEAALQLLGKGGAAECVALLFLGYSGNAAAHLDTIEQCLGKETPKIGYPVRVANDAYFSRMLTTEDVESAFEIKLKNANVKEPRLPQFVWRTLSLGDISVMILGEIHRRKWKTGEEYLLWKEAREENPYLHWRYKDSITLNDVRNLEADPLLLLKLMLLNNRWIAVDEHNNGMPDRYTTDAEIFIADKADASEDRQVSESLRESDLRTRKLAAIYPPELVPSFHNSYTLKTAAYLNGLAAKVSADTLVDAILLKALTDYNLHYRTGELNDYGHFTAFVLAVQKERLFETGRTTELWDVCYFHWRHCFLTWPFKDYLARLLFALDAERMRPVVEETFNFTGKPDDDVFTRNGLLAAMIVCGFDRHRALIERWFWHIRNLHLDHHPSERETILKGLKSTSQQTRKLYEKIRHDKRFKKRDGDP